MVTLIKLIVKGTGMIQQQTDFTELSWAYRFIFLCLLCKTWNIINAPEGRNPTLFSSFYTVVCTHAISCSVLVLWLSKQCLKEGRLSFFRQHHLSKQTKNPPKTKQKPNPLRHGEGLKVFIEPKPQAAGRKQLLGLPSPTAVFG